MSEKNAYAGKIKNSGAQIVKAPNQLTGEKKGAVRTDKDLRVGINKRSK